MNIIRIPKRRGEFRTIYAPNTEERKMLNTRLNFIALVAEEMNKNGGGLQHGFQPARSPVTNAIQHINYEYTLTMDLKDFFDSVTPDMVPETIRFPECFPDGAARQGLPTSPALANIAACRMDREIAELCDSTGDRSRHIILCSHSNHHVCYTRYADDLTFSCNAIERLLWLRDLVPNLAKRHGFEVKRSKTRIQWARNGRRIITGIAVDSTTHPTRSVKRRIRAARHQRHTAELRGLEEWAKCKLPSKYNASVWQAKPQPQTTASQPIAALKIPEAERHFSFQHD